MDIYKFFKDFNQPLYKLVDKLNYLDLQIQQCSLSLATFLFADIKSNQTLELLSKQFQKSVCGKPLNNCVGIKCQTCSNDLASVICLDCFDESKHIGHKYTYLTANGMCDCGFACTIKPEGFCSKHCGNHVIRDFEEEKQLFNEEMCIKVIYTLTCLLAYHLINKNTERYRGICSVIRKLLYDHPIDFLKSIFTKCLFINPDQSTIENMINFGNFQDHILPYYNLYNLRTNIQETGFKHIPLICIICQSEEFIPDQGENDISHYLVEFQISEPNFRSLMMYSFYMRYQDLISQVFGSQISEISLLSYHKLSIFRQQIKKDQLIQNQFKLLQFQKQIWCSAPVQLDSNIQLDNHHSIIINFIQLVSYTLSQQNGLQSIYRKSKHFDFNTAFLVQYFNEGIIELQDQFEIQGQNICSSLVKDLSILFNNSIQFLHLLPCIRSYSEQLELITQSIDFINNMKYTLLTLIYSMKNSQYNGQISRFKLSLYGFCLLLSSNFIIETIRIQNNQVIQKDTEVKRILERLMLNGRQYYDFVYEIYTGIIYGYKQPTYNFQSSICRVNDDFDQIDLSQNKYYQKQINNVVELSVYFLLVYSLNQRFQFCYSNNNYYPQIPYGFGLHTQIPLNVDQFIMHPVDNQLTNLLSYSIQAYYLYQKANLYDEPYYDYFIRKINNIQYLQASTDSNIIIIACWSMRVLVTVGLLESNFFKSLIDIEEYLKCILFQHSRVQNYNPVYHNFIVLQTILLGLKNNSNYNMDVFLSQFLEQYGLLNPINNELVLSSDHENEEKFFLLQQHFIKSLMQIVFRNQLLENHSDIKLKYILAFLILNIELKPSQIYQQFKYNDFYNSEIFELLLQKVCTLSNQSHDINQFYKSSNNQVQWQISENGLGQLYLFDSFCANIPQFLSTYKTQALKYNLSILPQDTFCNPFDIQLTQQVFTNSNVIVIVKNLVQSIFILKNHTASVLNNIYILLAFKQLLIYNSEDLELIKLFNIIPKDENIYQDQEWIVLNNIIELLNQKKKEVKKISIQKKLAQLKAKSQPTKELFTQFEKQENVDIELNDQEQQLIMDLKIIFEIQPNCQVCQDISTNESTLCILGTFTPIKFENRNISLGQTCTHLFHYECIPIKNTPIKCPICRCLSTTQFPIKFSVDDQECIPVINSLLQRIYIGIENKQTDAFSSFIQLNSLRCLILSRQLNQSDIEEILTLINLLLMTAYQQQRAITSRIQFDNISTQQYKVKQYQLVFYTSYSCIFAALKLYEIFSRQVTAEQINYLTSLKNSLDQLSQTLFNTLILQEQTENNIITQAQQLLLLKPTFRHISHFENQINNISFKNTDRYLTTDITFESFENKIYIAQLVQSISSLQTPPITTKDSDFSLFNFPHYFSELLKNPQKCTCGKISVIFCVFCGQGFCCNHCDNFSHSCTNQNCFYIYEQNILIFTDFHTAVYYTGGPYLDDNGEDDIQRAKNIPLYLSLNLLDNLKTHLLYCNTRQMNSESCVSIERFSDLIFKWQK